MILNRGSTMPIGTKIRLLPKADQPTSDSWQCIYEDDILPTGVITDKKLTHGLLDICSGFNIEKSNGKTYRVPLDVKFEVLDGELPEEYFIHTLGKTKQLVSQKIKEFLNFDISGGHLFYKIFGLDRWIYYLADELSNILSQKRPIYTFDEWLILINKSKKVKTEKVISTFKEGDWITLLDKDCCCGESSREIEVGKAYQILESGVNRSYEWSYSVHNAPEKFFCFADNMNNLSKCLRASTPKEIELAKNSTPIGWKPGDFWEHKNKSCEGLIGTELKDKSYFIKFKENNQQWISISTINNWVKRGEWIINPVKSETISLEDKDEWKVGDALPAKFLNSDIKIYNSVQNEFQLYVFRHEPNFVGDRVVDYILDSCAYISGTNKILLLGLKKDYPTYNTFLNNFKPKQITKQDEKDNNISSWSKDNDRQSSCSSSRKESGTSAYIPGDSYGIAVGQRRKGTAVRSI